MLPNMKNKILEHFEALMTDVNDLESDVLFNQELTKTLTNGSLETDYELWGECFIEYLKETKGTLVYEV